MEVSLERLQQVEVFWKAGERYEAHLVAADGRMVVTILRGDGALAAGPSRYRHALAPSETREDILLRAQIAISLFCHGAVDNPHLAPLRARLSGNIAHREERRRAQDRWAVPVPAHLPEDPWFGRALALEHAEHLAGVLRPLGEAPLRERGGVDVLRCSMFPSFQVPLCVRVSGPPTLALRGAVGLGHPARSRLDREILRSVSEAEWAHLCRQIEPTRQELVAVEDQMGLDGTTWLLEAHVGDLSIVARRWCPRPGPFAAFCRSLIALAFEGKGSATPGRLPALTM